MIVQTLFSDNSMVDEFKSEFTEELQHAETTKELFNKLLPDNAKMDYILFSADYQLKDGTYKNKSFTVMYSPAAVEQDEVLNEVLADPVKQIGETDIKTVGGLFALVDNTVCVLKLDTTY